MAHSYEQVMEALRAADKAGNVEDAQRLAQIAKNLRQEEQPSQTMESIKKAAGLVPEFMGEIGKTLAGTFMPGSTEPSGTAEAGGTMLTGMAGMIGGLPPAGLKSINNMTQGQPANFEQNYADAIDRFTYAPKTESGQEKAEDLGAFINRNLVPLGPMGAEIGGNYAGAMHRAAVKRTPKSKANVEAAAADIISPKIEETIPPVDRPPIQMTPEGQGILSPQDAMFKAEAERKAALVEGARPVEGRDLSDPFGSMKQQLDVPQQLPRESAAIDQMAQQLQGEQPQRPLTTQEQLPLREPLELEQGPLDLPPKEPQIAVRGPQEEMLGNPDLLDLSSEGKMAPPNKSSQMKGPQQEMLGNPDLFELQNEGQMAPKPKNPAMTHSDEVRAAAVEADPRMVAIKERVTKMEEAYIKTAEAFQRGELSEAHVKRMEKDLKGLDEAAEFVRRNVETELRNQERKSQQINSKNRMNRQRGAINPEVFREGFEKIKALANGLYLRASSDGAVFTVTAHEVGGKELGRADFIKPAGPEEAAKLKSDWTSVAQENRGQGIATKMYKFAAELGNDISKSSTISQDGLAMWKGFEDRGLAQGGEIKGDRIIKTRTPSAAESNLKNLLSADAKTHIGALGSTFRRPGGPGGRQGGYILLEGKKKKALDNLSTKLGIETKLKEIAPSQWTPEEAINQAKMSKDLDQNLFQKGFNFFTKGGLYQALKTHNPLVRYTYEKFVDKDRQARADIRDRVHDGLAPKMRDLSNKEQAEIWNILDLADAHEANVSLETLAKHGFNEKQIALAEEHARGMAYTFTMINKALEAAGKPHIDPRTAYAAMRSTGDFRRLVYDEKGGKVVGVIGSDFRNGLEGLKGRMEEQGYFVGEERYFGGMPRERGSANQAFMHAIEILAENDPKVREFIDVLHEIRTTEVYNFLNMKKHTMEKKGVFGMEGRKSWLTPEQNAKEGFKAQLAYMEGAIKWGHLAEAVRDVKQVLDSPDVKMPNAKAWSEGYMYNALGFNPSEIGRSFEQSIANVFKRTGVGYSIGRQSMAGARQLTNTLLLSLNPRFWATNVVQPLQSMPGMKAMLIARGLDAGFDFGTGYSYLAEGGATAMKRNLSVPMSSFEKQMIEYGSKKHVYGSDMIEHSSRVRKNAGYYAERVGNAVAGKIESGTRQVMFYGFSHLLKENGMKVNDGLFEAANNLTDMAMNNYSALERPQIYNTLGPIGDLAVNLQSYKHNELSRLALFARHAAEHKSMRPVLAQMSATVAFGGLLGFVAFEEADWLYRMITKAAGAPDSLTNRIIALSETVNKKVFDETNGKVDAPYVVSHGLPSLLGIDMSRSLGLTDVVPDTLGAAFFPGGSKLGEMAGSAYDLAKSPSEMNAKRAARAFAPIGAQGIVDNAFFTKETPQGTLSLRPRDLTGQAYRNDTDKMAKNFAFTGLNESVQRTKTYNIERTARDYADLRQGPLDKMRDQLFATGKVDKEQIMRYLKYRGDLSTLEGDLNRYAQQQHLSAKDIALLRSSASSAIGSIKKAQDYANMFKNNK